MTRLSPILGIGIVLAFIIGTASSAKDAENAAGKSAGRVQLYDEKANGEQQIAKAVAQAKKENKHVLVVWGFNACSWCHKLEELFKTNKQIRAVLKEEYVVQHVNVMRGHNETVPEKFQATINGYPYLTVVDGDGKTVVNHDTGSLEDGPKHDPAKVLGFLQKWKLERGAQDTNKE